MLRTLSSFFDPLGILQPIIVGLKIMFQEACKFTKDWDEVLSNDIQQKWFECINEIIQLKSIKVNRTYTKIDPSDPISNYKFHGFSDASDEAYGACIYLKPIHESGNIQTSLITSKSKVAPIKLKIRKLHHVLSYSVTFYCHDLQTLSLTPSNIATKLNESSIGQTQLLRCHGSKRTKKPRLSSRTE